MSPRQNVERIKAEISELKDRRSDGILLGEVADDYRFVRVELTDPTKVWSECVFVAVEFFLESYPDDAPVIRFLGTINDAHIEQRIVQADGYLHERILAYLFENYSKENDEYTLFTLCNELNNIMTSKGVLPRIESELSLSANDVPPVEENADLYPEINVSKRGSDAFHSEARTEGSVAIEARCSNPVANPDEFVLPDRSCNFGTVTPSVNPFGTSQLRNSPKSRTSTPSSKFSTPSSTPGYNYPPEYFVALKKRVGIPLMRAADPEHPLEKKRAHRHLKKLLTAYKSLTVQDRQQFHRDVGEVLIPFCPQNCIYCKVNLPNVYNAVEHIFSREHLLALNNAHSCIRADVEYWRFMLKTQCGKGDNKSLSTAVESEQIQSSAFDDSGLSMSNNSVSVDLHDCASDPEKLTPVGAQVMSNSREPNSSPNAENQAQGHNKAMPKCNSIMPALACPTLYSGRNYPVKFGEYVGVNLFGRSY